MRPDPSPNFAAQQVLICQNHACIRQGSRQVLAAFRAIAAVDLSSSSFEIIASGCLGRCGSGPMVLLPPEQWYRRVDPAMAESILRLSTDKTPPIQI
ncbi:MAG: (2Fe-2S) ferredoxin domain-containing protein [Synechococcaceae cyanobacterium RM1_1_27]|nr:(2Fe-2S) ferredoxin domain-containing protein [Synechococcaceae cyanobacterium SM2_3_2]NJO86133.1 (2Fe-2S) ferredoxin domain-containing protein [Synechococcaceae cyanobacterium RM1_1_27]